MQIGRTIEDFFEILETNLVYVDAPIAGFALSRGSNQLHAFCTTVVVPDLVWHWVLVPTSTTEADPVSVLAQAARVPGRAWFSVLEDRRGAVPAVSCELLRSPLPRRGSSF